ncbi:MAG: hypothetical protein OHK0015_17450 [Chloroflexi bacterium OHK40]
MTPTPHVDPERIGALEAATWRAYYDRAWVRLLRLIVLVNREQFGMSRPDAIAAAADSTRAAVAFAPADNDLPAARRHLARYYRRVRRAIGARASVDELVDRELQYWVVHRELAIRRKRDRQDNDIEPMVIAFAELHAALFNATPARMRTSAELRALACVAVDRITGGYSDDEAADWERVDRLLRQAYRSVQLVTGRAGTTAPTTGGAR